MSHFETALSIVLSDRIEGGFSNRPNDPGGMTMRGVSIRAVRLLDKDGKLSEYLRDQFDVNDDGFIDEKDVPDWTRESAEEFYKIFYWDAVMGDALPWPLSLLVFDSAVNEGVVTAIKHLQRTVRVTEDGIIGSITRLAAEKYSHQMPELLFRQYSVNRLDRYRQLRPDLVEENFRGWAGRVLDTYVESLKEVA